MKNILKSRIDGISLDEQSAKEIVLRIGRGEINPSQIAAFLSSYWYHPIQVQELKGFVDAMLELAVTVDLSEFDAMDVCGTGGDGKDTFNISTTSSFVVVGAGQKIAKHGNHGVSSAVGSSTVLEFLGIKFKNDESYLKRKMENAGICFLHAPLFHPAMRFVGPIRKELGMKTFFNLLGPLLNPAKVNKQLTGVYSAEVFDLYHEFFKESGKQFGIVFGEDGYDEISLTSGFRLATNAGRSDYEAHDLGLGIASAEQLSGGSTVEHSADIMYKILQREGTEAQTNAVLANAGAALWVAQKAGTLQDGIAFAKESLESGKAFQAFKKFIMD
ncbi:anthranilate phosphoribosyltransferase [Sandaracinomonas limnophila]|uniref:Anthranilate phosphoribosyltransferase n=1 Tax=Sandaracinomonas limnophila TaxID=1862386 RepID=A0A437PUF9_9BACT|nr:anthranilate phosphoribosyltransferase [Sandaracinomonas limnophila]RVU25894.1 anthranilate phosphoribosyltransferase [Sandaracinomonas limnophila]